eukprot:174800-Prymnesium_polylepis.1
MLQETAHERQGRHARAQGEGSAHLCRRACPQQGLPDHRLDERRLPVPPRRRRLDATVQAGSKVSSPDVATLLLPATSTGESELPEAAFERSLA